MDYDWMKALVALLVAGGAAFLYLRGKNNSVKTLMPYAVPVLTFIVLALAYCQPVLSGKKVKQSDITNFKGMSKAIVDHREAHGEDPQWTDAAFGGMPAYLISVDQKGNLFHYIDKYVMRFLPQPADLVFLYMLGFFIMLLCFKVDPWIAMIGAMGFAFSSYFLIILEAGHNTKAMALGYMPPILGGMHLALRGKYAWGTLIAALFLALQIKSNHPQITYYTGLALICYAVARLVHSFIAGDTMKVLIGGGLLLVGAGVAVGANSTRMFTTLEYSDYSTRGKSDLTLEKRNENNGLDFDYITNWSYGVGESWSLLVPDFKGGGSALIRDAHPDVTRDVNRTVKQYVDQSSAYFGDQPGTSGPVYLGAIVCFLFLLGFFYGTGPTRWGMLAAFILALMLSWGKNFPGFTQFFLDTVPGYSKFRAVSMILVVVQLAAPVVAFLGLNAIVKNFDKVKENLLGFYIASGVSLGLPLLMWMLPDAFNTFMATGEYEQIVKGYTDAFLKGGATQVQVDDFLNKFLPALEDARKSIYRADAIRSFGFVLGGAAVLFLYLRGILKSLPAMLTLLGLLIVVDLWSVDKRYFNNSNFENKARVAKPYTPSVAVKEIQKDGDPNFRVFNCAARLDSDAETAYFVQTIGGYHGAKMGRYQEVVDYHLGRSWSQFRQLIASQPSPEQLDGWLKQQHVLNMFNPKYIIYNPGAPPIPNQYTLGNAWFVDKYRLVANADSAMLQLGEINTANECIVEPDMASHVEGLSITPDPGATVNLTEYKMNDLTYEVNCSSEQLLVFSEVYYGPGWHAAIDGQEVEHFRVNYLLRGMRVPAGQHTINFRFDSGSLRTGEIVSFISSLLMLAAFGFFVFRAVKAEGAEESADADKAG